MLEPHPADFLRVVLLNLLAHMCLGVFHRAIAPNRLAVFHVEERHTHVFEPRDANALEPNGTGHDRRGGGGEEGSGGPQEEHKP